MIIYEVNIQIEKIVYKEYLIWLKKHITGESGMLSFPGFIAVDFFSLQNSQLDNKMAITIHYRISSMQKLNNYLTNHADKMRQQGIELFGRYLTATRRILKVEQNFLENIK